MSSYTKDKLSLVFQAIAGPKTWLLSDTGVIGDVAEAAGYITNAKEMGMDTGDFLFIRANNGQLTQAVHGAAMSIVQDTGATQGTVGLNVLIGDTS